jgi:SAM-dependent methyltransferase
MTMAPTESERRLGSRLATSFGAISEDYDRYRLEPAPAALEWLLRPGFTDVLDVGAGTGQLTRLLVEWGADVTAVEPDDRMRDALGQGAPTATILAGTAERLPVDDGSQDAVLAHAAWHWFDPKRAVAEAARVLRPGGRLGVLRTGFDANVEWVGHLWDRLEPDQSARRPGGRPRRLRLPSGVSARWRRARHFGGHAGAPFEPRQGPHVVHFSRRFTRDELLGLAGTYSGVIGRPPAERTAVLERVREMIYTDPRLAAPDGVEVPLLTSCWRAHRR